MPSGCSPAVLSAKSAVYMSYNDSNGLVLILTSTLGEEDQ